MQDAESDGRRFRQRFVLTLVDLADAEGCSSALREETGDEGFSGDAIHDSPEPQAAAGLIGFGRNDAVFEPDHGFDGDVSRRYRPELARPNADGQVRPPVRLKRRAVGLDPFRRVLLKVAVVNGAPAIPCVEVVKRIGLLVGCLEHRRESIAGLPRDGIA